MSQIIEAGKNKYDVTLLTSANATHIIIIDFSVINVA